MSGEVKEWIAMRVLGLLVFIETIVILTDPAFWRLIKTTRPDNEERK